MATKTFTLAECSKHNDNRSPWLVIHNNVYDVTEFLNEHPGGEEVLLEQAGKEASEAFEDVGHSSDARELMKKYQIGELVEADRKQVNEKGSPKWNSASSDQQNNYSTIKSWIVPITLGIVATILYRFYFPSP